MIGVSMKRFPIVAAALALLLCSAFAGPVSHFGVLKVCGSDICGSVTGTTGTPVMLKGPSLYWSDGTGMPFYNVETVDWFVDNMQIGVIRAAMAIKYYGNNTEPVNKPGGVAGYLQGNKEGQKTLIKKVIDAAIANDIYVIVDWHSHNANDEQSEAVSFFSEMAREYKDVPNIIWEIFNEPMNIDKGVINSYAKAVITAIRGTGNNNLVLIGSSNWSQNPSDQAGAFGTKDQAQSNNVAFTFHFYAAQGGGGGHDNVMTSANSARQGGYAVFGSEFGFTEANGKGNLNNASKWITWMDGANISSCNWSASNFEASSIFTEGTNTTNFSTSRFSTSGGYFKTYMDSKKWTSYRPSSHPKGNDVVKSIKDGASITLSTDLGLDGEISDVSQPDFGTVSKTANSITYTTPSSGSLSDKVKFIYKITKGGVTVQGKITLNITDRRPGLPVVAPIAVSRKAPTDIDIVSHLSVQDPTGKGVEFESVSVTPPSIGTATISSSKSIVTFTPDASQHGVASAEATLNYTVKVKNGTGGSTASVVLKLQNFAPTIRPLPIGTYAPSAPNTAPVGFGMDLNRFNGKDADGDPITIKKYYLADGYPGRLELVKPDSLVYYPEAGKKGRVVILAVITDGSLDSPTGWASVTLTGDGTEFNVTPPTSIPGVVDPPIVPVHQFNLAKSMGISLIGSGKIEIYFAQSGVAKLDVYSLSGKKMGSLLNEHQNAGSKQVSLNSLNLQKGVYILRLSQGSQVKTLRVVN